MLHEAAYHNFNELIAKVESPQFNRIPPINILKQEDVSYSSKFKLDNTAIKLANMAGGIQGRVPVAVSADGNCFCATLGRTIAREAQRASRSCCAARSCTKRIPHNPALATLTPTYIKMRIHA